MICWKCKKDFLFDVSQKLARGEECPLCHADLHVCRNCDFYDEGSHNSCRESSSDYVGDKEKANFCDYFRMKKDFRSGQGSAAAGNARAAFGALFGESGGAGVKTAESAKSAAELLFGDLGTQEEKGSAKDAFNALFG